MITDQQSHAALDLDSLPLDFALAPYLPSQHLGHCPGAKARVDEGGPEFLVTYGVYHSADSYALYCYDCMHVWPAFSIAPDNDYPSDDTIIAAAENDWGKPEPVARACCQCGARCVTLLDRDGEPVCQDCYEQPSLFSLANLGGDL
jgi:hypothetical protein